MKQKKKLSNTSSATQTNVTILDFFHARSASDKQTRKGKRKAKTITSVKHEVIVIDSDSDDYDPVGVVVASGGPAKRRKLDETTVTPRSAGSTSAVKVEDTVAEWFPVEATKGNFSTSRLQFGDPILLQEETSSLSFAEHLAPPPDSHDAVYDRPRPSRNASSEKVSGPICLASGTASCSSASSVVSKLNSPKLEVDLDLTSDSWEMGDDEFEDRNMVLDEDSLQDPISEAPEDCDPQQHQRPGDAFSALMSGFKENQAWKEADVAEDRNFRANKSNGNRRKAPFYKVLQGMPIAVDAFKYGSIPGVTAYFLTHAHSDHYTNLSSSWKRGPIYCSEGTANLIIHMLSVDRKWVYPLTMDTPTTVPDTGGVQVTLIEANHCPGSCLFLFEGRQTVNAGDTTFKSGHVGSSRVFRYLHCGDFRASPRHVLHPAVHGKLIDQVYLDTTYLDPKYTFPPQALVVSACADLASKLATGVSPTSGKTGGIFSWLNQAPKDPAPARAKEPLKPILFVVGTYSIGKERIVKAVAKALNSKVYCDKRKAAILKCQADPELDSLLTSSAADAVVHLLPLGMITSDRLPDYFDKFKSKYSKVVGFRPTGWTYVQPSGTDQLPSVNAILTRTVQKVFTSEDLKASQKSTSAVLLYPVPYSEHSSFYELTCFAMSLNWGKMIATVNVGSEKSRGKMAKWFLKWEVERKKRGKTEVVPHRHLDYW